MALSPLRIVISGVDQFSKEFRKIEKATKKLSADMKAVGKAMTTFVTLPVLAGAAASVKLGADFDYAMRKMMAKTTEAGVTFAQLREQAKMLGATTQFSATDAASAMEMLGAAGWSTKQIFEGIPGVMSMAAASDVDMATAADIAVSTMSAFGLQAKEASRIADIMATAANASAIGLVDIGESMKYAAPVARQFGASLEDTSAAVAFLGNIGIKGSMAGTNLATMFARLSAPTDEAAKTLKNLGVNVADAKGNMLPYIQILGQLGGKFEKLTQQQRLQAIRDIFGLEAMKGAAPMIAEAGGAMSKLSNALNNVQPGAAQKMVDIMTGGATGSFLNFKSAVEGIGIAIAESGLLDAIASMAKFVSGLLGKLSGLNPIILKTATIAVMLVAAIGPLLLIAGSLVSAFAAVGGAIAGAGGVLAILSNPITLTIAAVVAIGIALWQLRSQLQPVITLFKAGLAVALGVIIGLWNLIKPALMSVWLSFKNLVSIVAQLVVNFWPLIAIFAAIAFGPALAGMIAGFMILVGVVRILLFLFRLLTDGIKWVMDQITKFFSYIDSQLGGPMKKLLDFMGGKLPKFEMGGATGTAPAAGAGGGGGFKMPTLPAVGGTGTAPMATAGTANMFSAAPAQESKVVIDFKNMPTGVTATAEKGSIKFNYNNGLTMAAVY
jgi:TP901 family phage tail tape measure protein